MICLWKIYITFVSILIDNMFAKKLLYDMFVEKYITFVSILIDNIFPAKLLHDMFAEKYIIYINL